MPRRVRHDGRVVVFPDGTSDDEVIAFLGQQGDTSEEEAVLDAFSPRPAPRAPEPPPASAGPAWSYLGNSWMDPERRSRDLPLSPQELANQESAARQFVGPPRFPSLTPRAEPPPPPVPSVTRPSHEIADQAPDDAPSSFRPVLGDAPRSAPRLLASPNPLPSGPPAGPLDALSPLQRTARRRLTALDPFGPLPETSAGSGMPAGLRSGAMRPLAPYRREAPVDVLPAIGNQAQAGIMGLIGNLAQAPQGLERAVISPLMDALAGDQDTDHGMPANGLLGPRRPQMLGDVGPPQELPETWGPPNTVIPGDLGLRFGRDEKGELNWRGGPPDKDTASLAALTQEAQANLSEDTPVGRQLARARQQHPLETYSDPGVLAGIAAQGVPSLAAAYLSNRFGGAAGGIGMTAALEGGGATEDLLQHEKETGQRVDGATASEAILKTALGNALMEQLGPEAAMSKLGAGSRIPLSALAEAIPEGLQEANQARARELYAPPNPDTNRQILESTLGGLLLGGAAAAMPGHERPAPPPRFRGAVDSVEPAPQPMLSAPPGPLPGEPSPLSRGPFLLSPEQKARVQGDRPPPGPVLHAEVVSQVVPVAGDEERRAYRDAFGPEAGRVQRDRSEVGPIIDVSPPRVEAQEPPPASGAPPAPAQRGVRYVRQDDGSFQPQPQQDAPAPPPRRPLELPAPNPSLQERSAEPPLSAPRPRDPLAFQREVPEDLLPRPARRPLPLPEPPEPPRSEIQGQKKSFVGVPERPNLPPLTATNPPPPEQRPESLPERPAGPPEPPKPSVTENQGITPAGERGVGLSPEEESRLSELDRKRVPPGPDGRVGPHDHTPSEAAEFDELMLREGYEDDGDRETRKEIRAAQQREAERVAALPKTLEEVQKAKEGLEQEIDAVTTQIRRTVQNPEARRNLARTQGKLNERLRELERIEKDLQGQNSPNNVPGNNAPPNNAPGAPESKDLAVTAQPEVKPQAETPPAAPPKGKETPWDGRRLPENSLGKNPAGTWSFNGRVRGDLLYTRQDGSPPTPEDLKNAAQAGPRLAGLKARVFQTEQEALDALNGTEPKKPTEVPDDQPGSDPVLEGVGAKSLPEPAGPRGADGVGEAGAGDVGGPLQRPAGPGVRLDGGGVGGEATDPRALGTAPGGGRRGPATRGAEPEGSVRGDGGLEGKGKTERVAGEQPRSGKSPAGEPEKLPEPVRPEAKPERKSVVPETPRASNYVITDPERLFEGGAKGRARRNIEAIRTMRDVLKEGRDATPEEQEKIAGFIGWGGIKNVFQYNAASDPRHEFHKEAKELQDVLEPDEWDSAAKSALNAHYTDPYVVPEVWRGLQRMGLKGGRMLEPSVGIGYFFGLMPAALRGRLRLTGIELERQTGAMAKLLYPEAHIGIHGFQDLKVPNGFYDTSAGNVPFLGSGVFDEEYKKEGLQRAPLHDYFIIKTLDKVRPGGIVGLITSAGTMDKGGSEWRKRMQQRGDLVAAIRLPSGAFHRLAKTEVMTDLLFFRVRGPDEAPAPAAPWIETTTVPDPAGGEPIPINEYFTHRPEHLLGKLSRTGSMYASDGGKAPNVEFTNDEDFRRRLAEAIDGLPENVMRERETPDAFKPGAERASTDKRRPGMLEVKDGKLHRVTENGLEVAADLTPEQVERAKGMTGIRDAMDELLAAQAGSTDTAAPRKRLNKLYDEFVKKYGLINSAKNRKAFAGDPTRPRIEALENADGVKADIFRKDTTRGVKAATSADSPGDAVAISLRETGGIDMDRIAKLLKKEPGQAGELLVKNGLAYNDPARGWTPAEEYLAGDVKKKLAEARAAAKSDPVYEPNVGALEKVQPEDVPYMDIVVRLGSPFVDKTYIADFVAHMLDLRKDYIEVSHFDGKYRVTLDRRARASVSSVKMNQTWGAVSQGRGKTFLDLLDAAFRDGVPVVKYTDDDGQEHVDTELTAAAQDKLRAIKEHFQDWVWSDRDRRTAIARAHNDTLNTIVDPKFSASHYEGPDGKYVFPGMNPTWGMRPHQASAVWRVVRTGRVVLAHEVGSGKTATMITAAMELRRLSLAKKPVLIVPKNLIDQATRDAKDLYPGAKVFSTDGKFEGPKRKRAVSQIATGDWDLVLMTHEHMNMVPMSNAAQQGFIKEELEELRFVLEKMGPAGGEVGAGGSRSGRTRGGGSVDPSVAQIQRKLVTLEERLNELVKGSKKDDAITWEELGIDAIFLDEAHIYKKLPVHTSRPPTKGIATGSGKQGIGANLLMKTRWTLDKNNGRGVVFATGTPISNSLVEMYNLMRYLQPQELKAYGIKHFDDWASAFGETQTKAEYTVTGKIEQVSRFSAFVNVPELRHIASMVWDVKRINDLVDKDGKPLVPRPKKVAEIIRVKMTREQAALVEELVARAKAMKGRRPERGQDNMLSIATLARKGSLDLRMIGRSDAARKLVEVVSNIVGTYHKYPGQTQFVFVDIGVHKGPQGFSVYDEIIRMLVESGIPKEEIADFGALEGKAKRKAVEGLKSGAIRIGIGSSAKLGTGVNAQDHAIAVHHVDAPWRPDLLEQRTGRVWRYGNENAIVYDFRYATEGSFDAFMWQTITWKVNAIDAFLSNRSLTRRIEEPDAEVMSYSAMVAAASGVPEVMEKFSLEQEIKQLERAERARKHEIADAKADIPNKKRQLEAEKERLKLVRADLADVKLSEPATIFGHTFEKLEDAAKSLALASAANSPRWASVQWKGRFSSEKEMDAGTFRGLPITVVRRFVGGNDEIRYYLGRLRGPGDDFTLRADAPSFAGATYQAATLAKEVERTEGRISGLERDVTELQANAEGSFRRADELVAKRKRLEEVTRIISEKGLGKDVALTENDNDDIAAAPPEDALPDIEEDDDGPDDGGGTASLASTDMGADMAKPRGPAYRKPEVEDHQHAARDAADRHASKPLDPKEEVVTREQLSKALLRLHETLGAIPGSREFHDRPNRGALADFLIKSEAIRVRTPGDFESTVHEVAHHLQKYLWPASVGRRGLTSKVSLFRPHRAELFALATDPGSGKSPIPEGFAEFVRLYVTDEDTARAEAPGFFKAFEREMETMAPSVLAQIHALRNLYTTWKDHGTLYRAIAATWRPSWMDAIPTWGDTKLWAQRVYWGIWDSTGPAKMVMDAWREQKGRDAGASKDAYIVHRILAGKVSIGHAFLTQGIVNFHDPAATPTGKGLWQIYDDGDIIEHQQEWDGYSLLRRAKELLARKDDPGRKTGKNLLAQMGISESAMEREIVETERTFPKFAQAFEEDQEWNRGLLRYLRDAQVLSDEGYELVTELNQAHVHLQRFMGEDDGDGARQGVRKTGSTGQGIGRLGGRSQRSIVSPILARFRSAWMIPSAAERAYAGRTLVDRIAELEGGAVFGHKVPYKTKIHKVAVGDVAKQLEDLGIKVNEDVMDEVLSFFTQAPVADEKNQEVFVWRDPEGRGGRKEIWSLNSDLFNMMVGGQRKVGQPNYAVNAVMAVMKGFSLLKRAEIVLSLPFQIRNVVRDQATTAANEGGLPFVLFFKGLEPTIRKMMGDKTALAAQWERAGGAMGTATDLAWPELQKEFEKFLKRGPNELKHALGHPWRLLRLMSSLSEEPTRVGVYRMLMDNPLPQDVTAKDRTTRAAFRSREGGTDFARVGGWLRPWSSSVAFLTAGLGGTETFARAVKNNPVRAAVWGLALMALSAALRALIEEDPEKKKIYSELSVIQRALRYTLIVPTDENVPVQADKPNSFVIISPPKPFEWGYVFNTMFEYLVLDKIYDGEASKKEALKAFAVTTAPNVFPDLPVFLTETAFDWNTFSERPITSRSIEGLPVQEQYTARTSELAKAMSRLLTDPNDVHSMFFTPTKIDRGLRLGPLADYPLEAIDATIRALGLAKDKTDPPDRGLAGMPLLSKFVTQFPGDTKSVDRFYKFREEAAGALRAASQKAEAKDYQGFHDLTMQNDILRYVPVEWIRASGGLQKKFSDWNVQARAIRDSNMSPAEKALKIEEINVKIWLKSKAFMEAIDHYRAAAGTNYTLQLKDIKERDRSDPFDPEEYDKTGKVKMKPRERRDPFAMR